MKNVSPVMPVLIFAQNNQFKLNQIKSNKMMKFYTENNGRYSHPYATANDVAEEK